MGFFKDLRNVPKQAQEMTPPEYRGMGGLMRMSKDSMAQMSQTLGDMNTDAAKAQHLMANGRQGTATVVSVAQTGMYVNDNPQVAMEPDASVEGLQPYRATHRQVLAMVAIPQFQPGASVPVRVDPQDPQSLIVA